MLIRLSDADSLHGARQEKKQCWRNQTAQSALYYIL